MKKILVVDNQDSFVYNLVEMLRAESVPFTVVRCEELTLPLQHDEIAGVLLSPGGGLPEEYPQMMKLIEEYYASVPMLGVCLGHQAIAQCFGAKLSQLKRPLHGHASQLLTVSHPDTILKGLPAESVIGRYHSWVVDKSNLPSKLQPLAYDEDCNMMMLRHKDHQVWGVQFHPESVITDTCGQQILRNWLAVCYA